MFLPSLPFRACALAGSSLLLLAASPAGTPRVNAGNWEATMVTDGDRSTIVFCLTQEQAAALNGDSKAGRADAVKRAGKRCTVKSWEASGDTVSYELVCGDRTISDKTRYHGDTSEGVKTITFAGETSSTTITSKRLGACP